MQEPLGAGCAERDYRWSPSGRAKEEGEHKVPREVLRLQEEAGRPPRAPRERLLLHGKVGPKSARPEPLSRRGRMVRQGRRSKRSAGIRIKSHLTSCLLKFYLKRL